MVEDAEPDQIVPIWTWVYISGLVAAFFAPLSGKLVDRFELVPAVRGLYLFAFFALTLKFVILLIYSKETRRGKERLVETRGKSIPYLLHEYRGVASKLARTPATLLTLGLLIVIGICGTVNGTFWAILVTQKLGIPADRVSLFPMVRSLVMLLMFFLITPRIQKNKFHIPMGIGFIGLILSQSLLIMMPPQNYVLLIISAMIDAASLAMVNPLVDSLVFFTVDPQERARITAILYVVVFIFTSPSGLIAGNLSQINKTYPFVLNLVLFSIGLILTFLTSRVSHGERPEQAAVTP